MIRLRWGVVTTVEHDRGDRLDLLVSLGGEEARAFAFPALVGDLKPGSEVLLNTTAVDLGLGTGGVHLVVARRDGDVSVGRSGHAMKLRYSPLQVAVDAVEEAAPPVEETESLADAPVVVAGLHSMLAPVVVAAHATAPSLRIAYVMTDGAALMLAFSDTVRALRERGHLAMTVTTGQSTGGDIEAVSLHSGLLHARATGADLIVACMGPGNLGTSSRFGTAMIEVAPIADAVQALGGKPIVVPRGSAGDPRARHQGISHHTITALGLTYASVDVCVPRGHDDLAATLRGTGGRHRVIEIDLEAIEPSLRTEPLLRTMGRGYESDPLPFLLGAAAGVYGASLARA